MESGGPLDTTARLFFAIFFFIWNLFEGSLFHTPYPQILVGLYESPLWRLFLVLLLIAALVWCPMVGILLAITLFFYLGDLGQLTEMWIDLKPSQPLE